MRCWWGGWQGCGLVMVRMLCLMLVRLPGWMVLLARSAVPKDAGLLVLCHVVAVLRRQNTRPQLGWAGRAVLAVLAGLGPRRVGGSPVVPPASAPHQGVHHHRGRCRRSLGR